MRRRMYEADHNAFRTSASVDEGVHVREVMAPAIADRILFTAEAS